MGELPIKTVVFSPLDSGGVVQLEGTVGRQLRKSSLTSGGKSAPEIVAISAGEWSLLDMRGWLLLSSVLITPPFMCDTVLGVFFLNSAKASSVCTSFQSTH